MSDLGSLICGGSLFLMFGLPFIIAIFQSQNQDSTASQPEPPRQDSQAFAAWLAEKYPHITRFDRLDEETQQAIYREWREEWARRGIAGLYLANRINPINHDGNPHNDTFGAVHVPFTDSWKHFH